jgi:hypothetical protein
MRPPTGEQYWLGRRLFDWEEDKIMTPQLKLALMASALSLSAMMALPANATIVLADKSNFNGEEVIIDGNVGDTGGTILGHTNQSHVSVTYDGLGDTLQVGGSGQSFITGTDGTLTQLSYYLTDDGTFNNTEFKISGATSTVDFTVVDNEGQVFNFNDLTIDSSGFVAFRGIDGESISSVSFMVDNGGTFEEFRQLRLEVAPIPEPASWGMMLSGFGLLGGLLRLRRSRENMLSA